MLSLNEVYHQDFSEQFRELSVVDETRVVLAGGNKPLSGGRRSQHSAAVCCFDVQNKTSLWHESLPGNYPFKTPVATQETIAVAIDQNFTRKPTGIFWFDTNDGKQISDLNVLRLRGIAGDKGSGQLYYYFEDDEYDGISKAAPGEEVACLKIPHRTKQTMTEGTILKRVQPIDSDRVLALFWVNGDYKHELWSISAATELWSYTSKNDRCVFRNNRLITYSSESSRSEICEIDISSGQVASLGKYKGADISNLYLIDDETLLWMNTDRQFGVLDLSQRKQATLIQLDAPALGSCDCAFLPASNQIATLNTYLDGEPKAELKLFTIA